MIGLSGPELRRQANDYISFHKFLGSPERIPDPSHDMGFQSIINRDRQKKREYGEELERQLILRN